MPNLRTGLDRRTDTRKKAGSRKIVAPTVRLSMAYDTKITT